jgi:hypothetical protein
MLTSRENLKAGRPPASENSFNKLLWQVLLSHLVSQPLVVMEMTWFSQGIGNMWSECGPKPSILIAL